MTPDAPSAEATDPATTPARLAELAQAHPELGAAIVAHPAIYPALIEWIAEHGDAAGAAAARAALAPTVPAPPAPPTTPAPPAPPAPAASAQKRTRIVLIAAAAVIVLVLGVVAAIVVPRLQAPTGTAITTASVTQQPRVTWQVESPLLADADDDDQVYTTVHTVFQDRALVAWSTSNADEEDAEYIGQAPEERRALSLLDTRTGALLWTQRGGPNVDSLVGWTSRTIVISGDGALHAIDVSTGTERATSDYTATSPGAFTVNSVVDGTLLAIGDSGLVGLSADDLTERWTIDSNSSVLGLAGNRIVIGGQAYSMADGSPQPWNGDPDVQVVELDGHLFGVNVNDSSSVLLLNDDGTTRWSYSIASGSLIGRPTGDTIVFGDSEGGVATAIDLRSGVEAWAHPLSTESYYGGVSGAGRYLIPTSATTVSIVDSGTGEDLGQFAIDNSYLTVIGASDRVFYEAGEELSARDWTSGALLWTFANPQSNWYTYQVAGGNLIAVHDGLTARDHREAAIGEIVGIG